MAGGLVDELLVGGTGLDHVAITEDHRLGTLALDLTTDADLAALGAGLHDEADDTGASTADLEVAEELETEGLSLGHGGEATGIDALNIQGNAALSVLEALLDASGELTNAAALLAQDLLGLGGTDDDLSAGGGDAGLNTGEAILSELALEELGELSVEHAIADELALLGEDTDHVAFCECVCCGANAKIHKQMQNSACSLKQQLNENEILCQITLLIRPRSLMPLSPQRLKRSRGPGAGAGGMGDRKLCKKNTHVLSIVLPSFFTQ